MKRVLLATLIIFFAFLSKAQCDDNISICTPGVAGPFNFINTVGPPTDYADASCGTGGFPDIEEFAFITLNITTSGDLDILIDGDGGVGSGYLDVVIYNIPPGVAPCDAVMNDANEIGCNYAANMDGCVQLGGAPNINCNSALPAPAVNAGDQVMIIVHNYGNFGGTGNSNFTLELGNAGTSAQTGPADATITDEAPILETDAPIIMGAVTGGGTWSATCGGCIDPVTGAFDPSIAGVGDHDICYTAGAAPCDDNDCSTITVNPDCNIQVTAISQDLQNCSLTEDVTGDVTLVSGFPATGDLIVEDCQGNQQIIASAPFAAGVYNYALTNDADGNPCSITAFFSDQPACNNVLNYNSQLSSGGNEAGTFNVSHSGDGTNTPTPATTQYVLCDQDQFFFNSNDDWIIPDISGSTPDPTDIYDPGIVYFIYSCPPSPGGVGITPWIDDPCWAGFINGPDDITLTNNGGSADPTLGALLNGSNEYYIVPITFYDKTNLVLQSDCYDLSIDDAYQVQYLNPITFTFTEDCQAGTATITINGGYPEFYAGEEFTGSNLSDGAFTDNTAEHGQTITISGLTGGDDYSFDVIDQNGCPITINPAGTFPPLFDAAFSYATDTYCSSDADPSPIGVINPGGTYSSIQGGVSLNPGNGAIDLSASTGGTYDIVYSTEPLDAVCFDTDTFQVTINMTPVVDDVTDVELCGNYTIPNVGAIDNTNNTGTLGFYNGPNGTGGQIAFGSAWTTVGTTTIYIYDETGTTPNCSHEESFDVTINLTPIVDDVANQEECDTYTMPNIDAIDNTDNTGALGFYNGPNGTGGQIAFGSAWTTPGTTTIYIYDETGSTPNCFDEEDFTVTINATPVVNDVANQEECDSYTIPAIGTITNSNNTGTLGFYNGPNGTGGQIAFGSAWTTAGTTTIYIYDETGSTPNCFDAEDFTVTINMTPVVDDVVDAAVCDSYTLPTQADVDNSNNTANLGLYSAPNGGGTQFNFGDPFTTTGTTTIYIYDETNSTVNCFNQEQFDITLNLTPIVDDITNVDACDSYTLPTIDAIDNSNNTASLGFYNGPNGTGGQLGFGSNITASQTVYIFDETATTPNCFDQEDYVITISTSVNAGLDNGQQVCNIGGTSINLSTDLLDPTADAGGVWSEITGLPHGAPGTPSGAAFNAGTTVLSAGGLAEGTYTFMYLLTTTAPCVNDTAFFTINVTGLIDAGNDHSDTYCNTPNSDMDINTMLDAGITGGTWSETSGSGQFNNLTGMFDMSNLAAGDYTFDYSIPANGSCLGDVAEMTITINEIPYIDNPSDETVCDTYALPAITGTSITAGVGYYTAPNGGGTNLAVGANVTTAGANTIYVYDETGTTPNCFDQDTFVVTVNITPIVDDILPQEECDTYSLPAAVAGTNITANAGYFTAPNGGGVQLVNGSAITSTQTVYIYDETATTPNCTDEQDFVVTINVTPTVDDILDQEECDTYTLPVGGVTGTNITANAGFYTAPNGGGVNLADGSAITTPGTTTVYIYDQTATTPNCTDEQQFDVKINVTPDLDAVADQAECDSYTLPAIAGTDLSNAGYFTAPDGGGAPLAVGANITAEGTTTVYVYDETNTTPNCTDEVSFDVLINITPDIEDITDGDYCDDHTLPTITAAAGGVLTGNEAYYTGANGTGTQYNAGDVLNSTITLFIYDATAAPVCSDEEQVTISINNAITAGADNADSICAEGGIVNVGALLDPVADVNPDADAWAETTITGLSGGFDPATQLLDVAGLAAGNYTFEYHVDGVAPCLIATAEFTVVVHPLPIVDPGNYVSPICAGDEMIFLATSTNNPATFVWDNGVVNGDPYTPLTSNTYTVVTTDQYGCQDTDDVTIDIESNPNLVINPITSGCAPLAVTFGHNGGADITNSVWTLSNSATFNGNPVSSTFEDEGPYDITLEVTTVNGCDYTYTELDFFSVNVKPIASFTHGPGEYTVTNPEVEFTNQSDYANGYQWTFGDNNTSTEEHPTHIYNNEPDTYNVQLVAYGTPGDPNCVDTAMLTVQILDELLFHIPNTFTPDQDDFNETFQPVFISGFDPYDFTLLIFDRWGEVLFESHDASIGWDGKYGGKIVQDGSYIWKIDFKETMSDKRHSELGHVNVLR